MSSLLKQLLTSRMNAALREHDAVIDLEDGPDRFDKPASHERPANGIAHMSAKAAEATLEPNSSAERDSQGSPPKGQDHWSSRLVNSSISSDSIAHAYIHHLRPWDPDPKGIPEPLLSRGERLNGKGSSITNIYFGHLKALLLHFFIVETGDPAKSNSFFADGMLRTSFMAASDNLYARLRNVTRKYTTLSDHRKDETESPAALMIYYYSAELDHLALATWYMWQLINQVRINHEFTFMETTHWEELRSIWAVMDVFGGAWKSDGFERGHVFRYVCGLDPAIWEAMVSAKGNDREMETAVREVTVRKGIVPRAAFLLAILRGACQLAGVQVVGDVVEEDFQKPGVFARGREA